MTYVALPIPENIFPNPSQSGSAGSPAMDSRNHFINQHRTIGYEGNAKEGSGFMAGTR
ncbi:MAG: hypothetical protein A4E36_01054 [Methanoregulaceae archaeon PtaB.Bin009]|jgi:hypothetical protein|nr:MAG: hypothetical protein A4E36_01054 [Methanoregulaceae archaeon PtaB.Bin009]OPY38123.1 MAG: hypothetical protein A4E41_02125 [Methanoregulaceae archaeon PtaU1.Bin066]